jgi:hypothetical protein
VEPHEVAQKENEREQIQTLYFLFNRNSVLIMAHSTSPTTKDGACTPCVSKVVWGETGILDKCDRGECRRRTHGGEHTTCQRAHNVSREMDQ